MKSKAQAGMEYLMTYGWALAVITTILGLIFFIANMPAQRFSCSSSDPTKITMHGVQLSYSPEEVAGCSPPCERWGYDAGSVGRMILQNGTGGSITITEVNKFEESFSPGGGCTYSKTFDPVEINGVPRETVNQNSLPLNSGGLIEITPLQLSIDRTSGECEIPDFGFAPNHDFTIYYTDRFGLPREATITCSGFPPKQ